MPRFGEIVVIKRNGSDGTHFPLTTTTCLFGRKTECDIRIQLPMVSKEHCKIDVNENKEVIVTNLSSVNPALLNGTFIDQPVQLKHGDVITIIDRSFRFEYPLHSTPRKTRQSTSPAVEPVQQEINVESTHKKKRQQPSNSETSGKTLHENHSDDGKNLVNADVSKSPAKPSSSNRTPRRRSKSARTLSPFTELYEIFKHQIDTEPKQHDESEKKLLSKHINSPKKGNNQNILQENSAPETNLSRRRSERRSQIDIEKAINKVGKGDINFENQEISVEVNDLVKNPYSGRRLSASRKKHDSKEKDNTLLKENVKAHKQCVSGKDEEMWSNRDNTAEVSNSVVSTPKCKKSLQGSHSAEDKIEMNSSSDVLQNEHIAPKSQVSSYDKGEEIPTVQYVDFISICKGTGGERVEGQKRIGKCPSPRKSLSAEQVLKEIQDDLSLADTFKNKSHASASEPYMVAFLSSPPKNSPKQSNMLSSILKDSGSTVPILEPFMLEMESVHETSASQKSSETPKGKLTAEHKHPSKRNVRLSSSKAFEDTNISDLAIPENLFVGEQTPASLNLSPRVRSRRSHTSEHIAKADSGIQDENQQLTSMCHEKSLMLKDSVATLEYPKLPPRRSNRKSLFQAEKAAQGIGETMTPQKRKSLEINVLSEPPTKRKRVSFGGQLSPELFDKRLPPNSPLKKGAIPARRSMAFGSSSPLATGRRSRGRRYSVIQEYSKQYHGKKSESRLSQSEKSSVASSVVNLAGLSSVETISTMKSLGMSSVDRASVNRSSTSNLDDDTVASSKRTPCSRSPANNLAEISSTLPSARKLSVGNSLKKSSRLKSSVRRTTADSPARALHGHSASNPSRRASVSLRSSSSFSPDTTRSSGLSLAKNHHGTVFTDQTLSSWSSSLTSPESSPGILPTGETPFRSPGLKSRGRTPTPKSSNSIPIGQSPSSRSHVLKSSRRSPDMSPTGQTPSSWSFGLKSEGRSRTAKSPGTSTIGQTPSSMSPVLQSVRKTRGSSDSPVSRLSGTSPTEVSLTLQSLGNSHNKSPFDRTLSSRSSALKLRGSPIATRSSGVALTFQTVSPGTPALGSPNTPRDISSSKSLATESSRHSLVLKLPGKSLVAVGSSIPPAWESQSSVSPELKSIARSLDSRNFSTLSTGWTQSSRSPAARPQSISPAGRTRFSKSSTAKSLNIIPDGQTPSSRSPTAIPQSISPAGWTPSSKSPGKFPEAISHSTFRAGRAPSSRSPVLKLPGRLPVVRPHSTSPASRTPSSRSPALKSPRRPPVARPQSTSPAGRSPVLKSPGRPPVARPQSASPVGRSPARKSPRRPPVARSQNASPAGRSPSSRSPGRPPVTRTQSASPAGRSPSSGSPERPPVARTQSASPAGRSPSLRSPGRPPVIRPQSASPAGQSPSSRSPGRPPVARPQSASPAGRSPSSRSPGRPPVARPQNASSAGRSPSSRSQGRPPVTKPHSASPAGQSPSSRSPGRPPVARPQSASPAGRSPSSRSPGRPPVARPHSTSPAGRSSFKSPGRLPVTNPQSVSPAGQSPALKSPGRPPVARLQSASPDGRSPSLRSPALKSPGRPPVARPHSTSTASRSSLKSPGRLPVANPQSASPASRSPSLKSPGRPPVARLQSASPAGRSLASKSPGRPPVARLQSASPAGRSLALKSPGRPPVARPHSTSPAGKSSLKSPGKPPVARPQSASPAGRSPSLRSPALKSPGRPPVARPHSTSPAGRSPALKSPGRPPVARPHSTSPAGRSPALKSPGKPPVARPHSTSPAGRSPALKSPGRPPVARPHSTSPAGRSPVLKSPGRPPVARPHSASPAGLSPALKSPGRPPVAHSTSPAGRSPSLKSVGRPSAARSQSTSLTGQSPSSRSPALKSAGRPSAARSPNTSLAIRSLLTRSSTRRLSSNSPSIVKSSMVTLPVDTRSPTGKSVSASRMSPGRRPISRAANALSSIAKTPGRPSSSWSTSILPNTELPSKSLALMSSIIFSDKLALDSSNARAFHSNSNEITHSNNTESIHSSPEMRELSLRKVYSEFTTVSSPHTPYKKGRFSISRIRTPPDSYKNIPEQLSVKGNFMGLNMPENCLTVQSEMLPVSSTPKQLRRKSMRSAAKKTPLCRQSNGNDALDAVRSKRKSGASVANLLVAKSWADVVKLGVARPQVKHVKKDALRAKLSKKKLTKSKQTPRKIKDHIGTGHADSPATIVIGRAHSRPVNMIGRAPLVLTNYAFNQNMKTNESFTGLVELFSTPVNEKERRNSRLSRVPKTDVNPTPFLAEISQMLTPKESGEMFISPLSTPDTTKRRHYNQDAVTRLLQGQRASSSSFVGIKKLMKTPKGRTAILKNVPGTNRNSTEVLEETDLKEMKKLMKSKNVTGIKSLIKISKEKRDSEASFSGVKRLFKTPRQKTKSVTDAVALKRLLKTPKQKKQLETNIVRHTRRTRILKQKGQPVKDMIGIRRILKTPKQKGQLVEDMVGVKRILKTPKQKEQPVEDMVGVRRIFKTPKQKGQPVEDMVGVRRIFKTPKQKGQPLEDMVGVKAIFDSPTKSKVTKELSVLQQNNASPKSPPSRNADESRVSVFGQNKVKEAYIKTSAVKLRSFRNKKSEQELKKTDQVKNNVISTRQSQHLNSLESSDRKILTRSSRKKQNNATTEAPAFLMKTKLVKEAQPCKLERKYNKNVKENDIKKMTDKNITTIQEIISLSNKDVDGYTLPQTRNKSQKKRVKYIFASDTREESKETVSKTEGNKGMTEELKETTEVENSHTSQRSRSLTKTESPKEKVNGRSIRKRQNIDAQKDFADMYIKLVEETNPAIKLPRKLNQNLNESDIKELSIENAQAKNVQVMQEDISLSAGEISISSLPKKRGRLRKVKIVGSSVAAQEKPMYKIKGKASEITKQIKEVENEIQKREVFSYSSVTEKKRGRRKKCIEDNAVFETTNQAKLKDVLKVKETARSTRIKRSGTQSIRDQESGESVFHDSQKKTKKSSPRIEKNLQTSEILTVNNSLLKQIDHIIETKKVAGQVKKSVQWHPLLTDFKTSVQTIKPNQETLEDEKEISSTSRRPGRKSILELKPSVVPAKRSRRENTVENNKQVSITTHFTIERKQTRLQTAKNIQKVTKQKITGSSNETVTETKTLRNAKQKAHPSQQFGKICETKKQIQEVESILSGQEESKELIVETRNVGGSLEDQTSIMPKSKVTRTAKRAVREQTIKSDSSINKTKAVTGRNQTISDPFSPFIGSPSFSALILDSNPSKNVPKADSRLRRYRAAAKNDDLHTKENEAMQKTSPVSNKNKAPIKTVTDFQPISQRTRRKAFAGAVVQETLIHTKEPSRNIRAALKRKLTNEVVGVIHQETSQQKLENQLESEGLTRAGRRANLSKNKIELEKNDFSYNAQDNISAAGGRQCLKEMEVTAHKMGRGKADKSENRRRGHSMAHEKNPSPVSLSRRGRRKQMTDEIHTDTAVQSIPSRSKSSLDDRTPAKKLKMGIEHNTVQQKNKRRKGR